MGLDPGTSNTAIAVLDVTNLNKPVLLSCSMFPSNKLIRNLTPSTMPGKKKGESILPPFQDGMQAYLSHFYSVLTAIPGATKENSLVTAERFMVRRLHLASIEAVGVMNGVLAASMWLTGYQTPMLVPASEWKAMANKSFDLKAFYKLVKKLIGLEPHLVDAVGIALWRVLRPQNLPFPTEECLLDLLSPFATASAVKRAKREAAKRGKA